MTESSDRQSVAALSLKYVIGGSSVCLEAAAVAEGAPRVDEDAVEVNSLLTAHLIRLHRH